VSGDEGGGPVSLAVSGPGIERRITDGAYLARFVLDDGAFEYVELGAEITNDDEAWAAYAQIMRERRP
jgi:hypothetical protein